MKTVPQSEGFDCGTSFIMYRFKEKVKNQKEKVK